MRAQVYGGSHVMLARVPSKVNGVVFSFFVISQNRYFSVETIQCCLEPKIAVNVPNS